MGTNRVINVIVTANTSLLSAGLARGSRQIIGFANSIAAATNSVTGGMTAMAAAGAAAGVAIAAGLTASVSAAIQFETRMRNVNSLIKLSDEALGGLADRALGLSRVFPQTANQVAEAFYDIASAGFTLEDEIQDISTAAAVAASAGLTDMATAVRAINAVINAFGYEASDAMRIADVLFQTVNVGIVTFEQLAVQLGDVVGTAAAAGLEIEEVGSAIATMTRSGLGADEAAVSLNRVLQSLIHPSRELAHVYEFLGYTSGAAALETKGLKEVIEELGVAVGQVNAEGEIMPDITALLHLFPEIRSSRGALALLANMGRTYDEVAEAVENASNVTGAAQAALAEQLESTSSQWTIMTNNVRADAIELGSRLIPAAKQAIAVLSGLAEGLATVIEWLVDNNELVLVLAAAYLGRLVPALVAGAIPALGLFVHNLVISTGALIANTTWAVRNATGLGKISAAFGAMGGSLGAANVAMLAFAAAAGLVLFHMDQNRRAIAQNDEALQALSQTAEDAIRNMEEFYRILGGEEVELSFWQQATNMMENAWRAATGRGTVDAEAQHRFRDFNAELQRLAQLSGVAALSLLETAVAAGDLVKVGDDFLAVEGGAFDIEAGVDEVVFAAGEYRDLIQLIIAQEDAAASASDAVAELEEATGLSAREMSESLGMPLDAYIELVEGARDFANETVQAFARASNAAASFDPSNPYEYTTLGETLTGVRDEAADDAASAYDTYIDATDDYTDAQGAAADASESLADAQEGVSDAVEEGARAQEDALRRIAEAEEAVADAQENVRDAQEGVNEAREEARERVKSLTEALEESADAEEKGAISLARARLALAQANADPNASPLARREAEIAVRDAERGLGGTREERRETAAELAELNRVGIEGSEEVLAAQERLTDAYESQADATRALSDAHIAAADAAEASNERIAAAVKQVADAEGSVADAQERINAASLGASEAWTDWQTALALLAEAQSNLENPAQAYTDMLDEIETRNEAFLTGLQELAERGLDDARIAELMAAGPEAATPIIEALLSDHSNRSIEIANEAGRRLDEMNDALYNMAKVIHFSINREMDSTNADLAQALDIAYTIAKEGSQDIGAIIALNIGESAVEVAQIARNFGIAIGHGLDPVLSAMGANVIGYSDTGAMAVYMPGGGIIWQAEGGMVPWMPGAMAGKDSVRAMLVPNEFVQPEHAVQYYGAGGMEAIRQHRVPRAVLQMFAAGGMVEEGSPPPGTGSMSSGMAWPYGQGPSNMGSATFGGVKPWVAWSGNLIRALFGVRDIGGVGPRSNPSDHPGGLALDFMTYANTLLGNQVTAYLMRNAVEHSIKYLIWQQHVNSGQGWRMMDDRGSITANHFDHVHASYMARAMAGVALQGGLPPGMFALDLPPVPEFPMGPFGNVGRMAASYARASAEKWFAENAGFMVPGGGPVEPGSNRALGQQLNSARGWGAHWNALDYLWQHESNWKNTAQNPKSSAYGIAQFLDKTWASVGYQKTSDPMTQILAGLDYIAMRPDYGNPTEALRMWQSRSPHWYALGGLVKPGGILNPYNRDNGGPLKPGFTFNGTRAAETVVPNFERFDLEDWISQLTEALHDGFEDGALSAAEIIADATQSIGDTMFPQGIMDRVTPDSGVVNALAAGALTPGASSELIQGAIGDIEDLIAAWEEADRVAEETAARDALWDQRDAAQAVVDAMVEVERQAQAAVDAAPDAEARAAAELDLVVAQEARVEAEMALGESIDAIIQFDIEAATAAEQRAIAETLLQLALAETIALNREAAEFEALANSERIRQIDRELSILEEGSEAYENLVDERNRLNQEGLEAQIASLDERIAAEEEYTDEWVRLTAERAALQEDLLDDLYQQAADAIAERDALLDELNQLLDRRQDILDEMGSLEVEGRKDLNKRILQMQKDFEEQMQDLLEERSEALANTFAIDERRVVQWGNTAAALIGNAQDQIEQFRQWTAGLAELEAMGFSQDVLMAMGLYAGPEALGQVQMLTNATEDEIVALNDAVATQQQLAGQQAEREFDHQLGVLGQQMTEAQEEFNKALLDLEEDFQEDLTERMEELTEELNNLGLDQGRTYSEAVAEGLLSGIPGIVAAAQAVVDATQAADEAVEAAGAAADEAETPPEPALEPSGLNAALFHGGVVWESNAAGTWLKLGGKWYQATGTGQRAGIISLYGAPKFLIGVPQGNLGGTVLDLFGGPGNIERFIAENPTPRPFDLGGLWPSGTLGINTSGHTERVLNHQQRMAYERGRGYDQIGRMGGGNFTFEFYMDGKMVATTVTDLQHRGNRRISLNAGSVLAQAGRVV